MGGWPDFFLFGFGFGSGSWANDFFLPFISLRDDGLFSNRRAKLDMVLSVFTWGFVRFLVVYSQKRPGGCRKYPG
jgi:hypothetical protein